MPCPGVGPCLPWDLDLGCCLVTGALPDPCLFDGDPVPQMVVDSAKLAASQLLWALTGRQFGCCTVTIRPCRQKCKDACCIPFYDGDSYIGYGGGSYPWYPLHLADGSWTNVSCDCQDSCSCTDLCEIKLPYPVCSIDEVRIDGMILDQENYKVLNFEKLVFVPGPSGITCWPTCNDLTKPDTEEGTWSVTLTYGVAVPELLLRAASLFACEIIKDCVGKPCGLPARISSVTRQGISVSFLDNMDFLDKGLTGIYFVDAAVRAFNPNKLMRRPAVYSPDVKPKWAVETWRPGDPIGPGCT